MPQASGAVVVGTKIIDPDNAGALFSGLLANIQISGGIPALHIAGCLLHALCRTVGIQVPALQVLGVGTLGQVKLLALQDQLLHGFQLPQQKRQAMVGGLGADQLHIDVLLLYGRQGAAFARFAASLAHKDSAPSPFQPGFVGGNDGWCGQAGRLADLFERFAFKPQFHGLNSQWIDFLDTEFLTNSHAHSC
ncbi:hypothetical protein [Comamonas thiooxydans]|uniref:hypothetical protein n=1 Tax=Comamonas thiooxydans TaxID=363952 RepID=UPI00244CB0B9|nr:hypothetical protein [Comamonas thiooxydans]MDH1740877.1 hypothetical protein [Comamonas thiooxydans]